MKKRGSVKAETSLSAVELSGKVIKRGYLLKQVSARHTGTYIGIFILKIPIQQLHRAALITQPKDNVLCFKGNYTHFRAFTFDFMLRQLHAIKFC